MKPKCKKRAIVPNGRSKIDMREESFSIKFKLLEFEKDDINRINRGRSGQVEGEQEEAETFD